MMSLSSTLGIDHLYNSKLLTYDVPTSPHPITVRGTVASRDIEIGEVIANIPLSSLLTVKSIKDDPSYAFILSEGIKNKWSEMSLVVAYTMLVHSIDDEDVGRRGIKHYVDYIVSNGR
jgi:hypothetical protein